MALLEALRADARLACVVACSSRDSLDAVAAALHTRSGGFNLAVLVRDAGCRRCWQVPTVCGQWSQQAMRQLPATLCAEP